MGGVHAHAAQRPRPGGYWLPGATVNMAAQALRMGGGGDGGGDAEDSRIAVVWREEGEGGGVAEEAQGGATGPKLHSMTAKELRDQCM